MTEPAPPPPPPTDYLPTPPAPRRPVATVLAWLVVVGAAAYIIATTALEKSAGDGAGRTAGVEFRLAARYAVGVAELFSALGTAGSDQQAAALLPQLDHLARTPEDRLRAAIVAGEVGGREAALERLDKVATSSPGDATSSNDDHLAAVRTIYDTGSAASLAPTRREALATAHGWFARLALSHGLPAGDPARREAVRPAERTVVAMFAAAGLGFIALVAGLGLLVLAVLQWSAKRLPAAYRPADRPTGPFLEAFAVYIAGMVGLSAVARFVVGERISAFWLVVVALPLAALWPLLRGVPRHELRAGLGWHRGRGVWREIGAGILGYVAALPLLAVGMVASLILQRLSGSDASHPIVDELGQSGWRTVQLFFLAAVWAPVVEETMFRGALYHHLRRRLPWGVAAALVALLFAAVHPQGWAGVPALGAIAVAFAGVRERRGSIIAPAVAHAINNAAAVLFLTLLLS